MNNEQKIDVYFNSRRRLFSVREQGKVIAHTDYILLRDTTFVVKPSGRRKVLRTGHKNVHAWVRGIPFGYINRDTGEGSRTPFSFLEPDARVRQVMYNPRKFETFVLVENNFVQVTWADMVLLVIDPSAVVPVPPEVYAYRTRGWLD